MLLLSSPSAAVCPESVEKAINDPVGGGILARPSPFKDRVLFQLDSKGLSLQASSTSILT